MKSPTPRLSNSGRVRTGVSEDAGGRISKQRRGEVGHDDDKAWFNSHALLP